MHYFGKNQNKGGKIGGIKSYKQNIWHAARVTDINPELNREVITGLINEIIEKD
jgi:hypothetical protein